MLELEKEFMQLASSMQGSLGRQAREAMQLRMDQISRKIAVKTEKIGSLQTKLSALETLHRSGDEAASSSGGAVAAGSGGGGGVGGSGSVGGGGGGIAAAFASIFRS